MSFHECGIGKTASGKAHESREEQGRPMNSRGPKPEIARLQGGKTPYSAIMFANGSQLQ
jgi:hypothetical protein